MEILRMSRKERDRVGVMLQVKQKKLSLIKASQVLGVTYRQAKRIWQRYRHQGDAGLVHRLRGRPSLRRVAPQLRERILARYQERYGDFGPTLAAEYLAGEDRLVIDHETLRRWLLAAGLWSQRRRRQQHRQWRQRKPCFGQMVQLDGSHHDWFEGRREPAVLMVMIDDATSRLYARFFEEETTRASYDVFSGWVARHGLPRSVYVDRDSIYRCDRVASVAEQVAGQEPQTQFGRAMRQLGVELILAHSPQAKGRVERVNGTLQDRLVKALRLRGLSDLESANAYLETQFLSQINQRFNVPAASAADVHRRGPANLEEILSWEEERVLLRDWTLSWGNQWCQIDRRHETLSLAGKKVLVRRLRDGAEQILYHGRKLQWRKLPERPKPKPHVPAPDAPKKSCVPVAGHPWRQMGAAIGTVFLKEAKKQGRAVRRAQAAELQSASATLRPPSIPPRQQEQQSTKGTFSGELSRGHF
jgi:transposase